MGEPTSENIKKEIEAKKTKRAQLEQELLRIEGKLKIQCAVKTLASERHPLWNEDSSFSLPEKGSFGIFDGVGGQIGGREASKLAREFFEKELNNLPDDLSQKELEHALVDLFRKAQVEFLEKVKEDEKLSKMATTVTVVKIWKDKTGHKKLTIMNAGDSRVYISKKEGTLKQATVDDSRINQVLEFRTLEEMEKDDTLTREQVESRIRDVILNFQNKINNLTNLEELNKKEKQLYDQRNLIMKVLDSEKCIPNVYTLDIEDGDKIILTSDGIHDNSTDTEISSTISSGQGCNNIAEGLTSRALYRSREKDNIRSKSDDMTAMVIEVIQPPTQPLQTPKLDDKTKTGKLSRLRELFQRSEKPKKLSVRMNLINPRKGAMESPSEKIVPAPKISKATKVEEEIQSLREESRRVEEAFTQATEMARKLKSEAETLNTTPSQSPILKKDQTEAYQKTEEEITLSKLREKIARVQEESTGIILDQNAKPFKKTEPSRNLLDLLNKARQGSIEHEDVYWHVFGGKSSSGAPYPASLVNRPDLLEKFAVGKNGEPYQNTRDATHDLIEFLAKEAEGKMRQS